MASTTTHVDQFAIQLDAGNRLSDSELMEIRLYAGDSLVPMWSRDWNGLENGLNGLLFTAQDWDLAFTDLTGRLTLTMVSGSVDLHRVSLSIGNGQRLYAASIIPDIRLVPEPGTSLCIAFAILLLACRHRRQRLLCLEPQTFTPSR